MPCDYKKYPSNWKEIRQRILDRDFNMCKFCKIQNYSIGYRDEKGEWHSIEHSHQGDEDADDAKRKGYKVIKIILTIMHLDHNTENNEESNLAAGCQKCHLNYDKDHHRKNSRATIEKKKHLQRLF